jgi:hypothetical protein
VYETESEYVTDVDPGQAVAVTLVDMRKDMPITLRRVRRGGNVRVTGYFNCWVTDPVEVVHARHLATMRRIRRLMRESLLAVPGFIYSDDGELRDRLAAWFANTTTSTTIPGMRVAQAGIQIIRPRWRVERAEYDEDYTEA